MKVLLVTSQITYMPSNYLGLFEKLLEECSHLISGLVLLNNLDQKTLKSTIGLQFLGAKKVSNALLKNIVELPLKKREKLFQKYNIPTFNFKSMNQKEVIDLVNAEKIDLIINLRTRCIYKKEILNTPKLGCLNIHHGILPKYRGTLCDLYALTEGRPAGFTIHAMNEKIDAGKILKAKEVSAGDTNYMKYLSKTAEIEAHELSIILKNIEKTNKLPDGIENYCENPIFTRNPNRKQIQGFLKQGFIL